VIDWVHVFGVQTPLLEVFLRGTLTYLALFLLLRLVLKRQVGQMGIPDLLVVVLIADAAQNAMAGGYQSITDGVLLVVVIVGWAYAIDWLGYRVSFVGRLVQPPALPLVQDGKVLRKNMRHELITMNELHSELRRNGIEDLSEVRVAYVEGDGTITVITRQDSRSSN
jgi:uncharacterized membrane protein YcaP (DUF421 family)